MPIRYWFFVGGTLLLVSFVSYGVYATQRLLRTWQPDRNLMLLPGENILRLGLIALCILLGLGSGLEWRQLGWVLGNSARQLVLGGLWGILLAIFFATTTQWITRHSDPRFYSAVVIKAIVPTNRRELFLILLAMMPVVLVEELLFRSLLVGGLTSLWPAMSLIFVTSLLFGLLHALQGIWGIVGATLAGLLFGLLFIQQGSLLAPLIAHYIANALQIGQAMRLRDQL
ncbi:MAG: CPBP family intramembrane metalloprotease [Chloroflexi bacterium]|nr:CPBP family intramembrane metalloprotease [Chloroflexota bacterium]